MTPFRSHSGPPPRVTIAMPVWNGEQFIRTAIESVLDQDFPDFELVITDNDSTDGTERICRAYAAADARIRYFRNEQNFGAARNYNLGLELARGTYFKWLAHDDWISANYITVCAAMLDRYPEVVLAHGMPREMLDEVTPYLDSTFSVPLWGDADPVTRFAGAMRMDRTCHAIFGLYRRSVLERTTRHRPYYTSDRNLVAETALLGRFVAVPEATFYNRKHDGQSMAKAKNRKALALWQDTANTKALSTERLSRLRHFWEISGRYPEIASRSRMVRSVASLFFSPLRLVRYVDEGAGLCFPRGYLAVRRRVKAAYRALRPARRYMTLSQGEPRAETAPPTERDSEPAANAVANAAANAVAGPVASAPNARAGTGAGTGASAGASAGASPRACESSSTRIRPELVATASALPARDGARARRAASAGD